jgi:hypothetical protein
MNRASELSGFQIQASIPRSDVRRRLTTSPQAAIWAARQAEKRHLQGARQAFLEAGGWVALAESGAVSLDPNDGDPMVIGAWNAFRGKYMGSGNERARAEYCGALSKLAAYAIEATAPDTLF